MAVTTSAESFFSVRQSVPDLLVRGRAVTVGVEVEADGSAPTISAATVSLLKPDGTVVVNAAAGTVSGGSVTHTIPATTLPATLTPLGEGWQLVWTLTIDGVDRVIDREAALIRRPLYPVIDDTDIEGTYPDISRDRGSVSSLLQWRREAWRRIVGRLIREGHLPYLIKSGWTFREPHIEMTCWLFYRWKAKNQPGAGSWMELSEQHRSAYEAAWSTVNFTEDRNHDGRVDDPATRTSARQALHIGGAPTTFYPSGL